MNKLTQVLKWLDRHTPLWIIKDILYGVALGWLVYLGLTCDLSHGAVVSVAHPSADVMIPAVASLAWLAWPLAITIGAVIAIMFLYLDWKSIKENGEF